MEVTESGKGWLERKRWERLVKMAAEVSGWAVHSAWVFRAIPFV